MKENYKKPMIYFESFALSQSIAANCKFFTEGEGTDIIDPELGETVFVMGADGPACSPDGDSTCYDVPITSSMVFGS